VALHGAAGQEHPVGDGRVGQPFGHQTRHDPFGARERVPARLGTLSPPALLAGLSGEQRASSLVMRGGDLGQPVSVLVSQRAGMMGSALGENRSAAVSKNARSTAVFPIPGSPSISTSRPRLAAASSARP
jgi:hypothetical protein